MPEILGGRRLSGHSVASQDCEASGSARTTHSGHHCVHACGAMPCCAVPCRAVPCHATLCGAVWCGLVRCRAVPCCAAPCSAMRCHPFGPSFDRLSRPSEASALGRMSTHMRCWRMFVSMSLHSSTHMSILRFQSWSTVGATADYAVMAGKARLCT